MEQVLIRTVLNAKEPCVVRVCGWVRSIRSMKDVTFITLYDGSTLDTLQLIVTADSAVVPLLSNITVGTSLDTVGRLEHSAGKEQAWDFFPETLSVVGTADQETYPLQKKRHSDEFLRTIAHLRVRTNKYGAMLRVRSEAAFALHSFFRSEGYHYVHTPIITGSDCEGAGEMFRVTTHSPYVMPKGESESALADYYKDDFFGKEASLTVSGQLEGEALMMGLGRIYTFGPTFRAENSNTSRHAAEFWMVEPECAFMHLPACMDLAERCIHFVVRAVCERSASDIALFNQFVHTTLCRELEIMQQPFARIRYADAVHLLSKEQQRFTYAVNFGDDLQTEHERFLAEEYYKKPVIVYDYPKKIKAFYMKDNPDGETVAAMDVLVPRIGELVGGSQREEDYEKLRAKIHTMGLDESVLWWYLDIRRFGTVPHSGFGIGFERLIMMLTGIANIRDVLPFPRTPKSLEF